MTDELFPSTLPIMDTLGRSAAGRAWLDRLPRTVASLRAQWSLRLEKPFHGGSCAWVAPATLPDGTPVVLKVGWPHREAAGEAQALRLWAGRGAARLLAEDCEHNALLMERVQPGHSLWSAFELTARERLLAAAGVLDLLWRVRVPERTGLESQVDVVSGWADLAERRMDTAGAGLDPVLATHGIRLLRDLPATATRRVVVHGDFNPGNVVAAPGARWLAIDAKPMLGDPCYDPWPLVQQIDDPFAYPRPHRVLAERFALLADALGQDAGRLQAWGLARSVETALYLAAHADPGGSQAMMCQARVLADLLGV